MQEREFAATFDDGVLTVVGSVADQGTFLLRNALREHTDDFSHGIVVDLTEVDYLPSVAIGVLAKGMAALRPHEGETLSLVAASGTVAHRVLSVSGMPFRDTLEATEDDEPITPA